MIGRQGVARSLAQQRPRLLNDMAGRLNDMAGRLGLALLTILLSRNDQLSAVKHPRYGADGPLWHGPRSQMGLPVDPENTDRISVCGRAAWMPLHRTEVRH